MTRKKKKDNYECLITTLHNQIIKCHLAKITFPSCSAFLCVGIQAVKYSRLSLSQSDAAAAAFSLWEILTNCECQFSHDSKLQTQQKASNPVDHCSLSSAFAIFPSVGIGDSHTFSCIFIDSRGFARVFFIFMLKACCHYIWLAVVAV